MPEANLFLIFTQRLNTLGAAYMVSGSVAVIIYGEPRLTHDVDLIVVLDRGHIARLPEVFPPAEFWFQSGRVSEWARSIARLGTGAGAAARSGRPSARRCPPEYVIVRKLEYYRESGSEKHLRDIRSMLNTSPEAIQINELEQQIAARGLQEQWRQVQERSD
jgi:hypothetical protein